MTKDKPTKMTFIEPTPEKMVQITFWCPESTRDAIKKIAGEQDRTSGKQLLRIVREWLKNNHG